MSTSENQSANPSTRAAAPNHTQAPSIELRVNIRPTIAAAHPCGLVIRRHLNHIQISQIDGNPALDVRGTGEGSVAATFHGERALGQTDGGEGQGDLLGVYGVESTTWLRFRLHLGPVDLLLRVQGVIGKMHPVAEQSVEDVALSSVRSRLAGKASDLRKRHIHVPEDPPF